MTIGNLIFKWVLRGLDTFRIAAKKLLVVGFLLSSVQNEHTCLLFNQLKPGK